jgi:uncharacterized membrane protein YbhN (UPF0104 family)
MLSAVNAVGGILRSARGRRAVNIVLTLVALVVSALAARHFASTGWPLEHADSRLVAAAALAFLASYPLKALAWHRLFAPAQRPEAISLAAANGAASVTGAALPGRFDDAVRIAVVRRYPSCPSCVSTVALSLFMLGLLDAAALMPISAAAAATSTGSPAIRAGLAVVAAAGLGAALIIALLPRFVASGRLIRFRLTRWVSVRLTSGRDARRAWLLTLASWTMRAVGLFLLLAALDVSISFPLAIGFLCAAAASAALPIAPAGAATQAGAGAAMLIASGIGTQKAIDFAVSAQALLIIVGFSVVLFAAAWHAGQRIATGRRTAASSSGF